MKLKAEGICVEIGGNTIIEDVSLSLEQPGVTAVLGPNGAGKTTMLRCLNGMIRPASGSVWLGDTPLERLSARQVAKEIAYVAQKSAAAGLTVFDAVLLGRVPHLRMRAAKGDLQEVAELLEELKLDHLALRRLSTLSGGELQKVSIARALAQHTPLMLLDEPTASLDLGNQLQILRLLRRIAEERGISILLTIHDINTAFRYADRFLFMRGGRISARAQRDQLTPEMVEHVYDVPVAMQWYQDHPMVMPITR